MSELRKLDVIGIVTAIVMPLLLWMRPAVAHAAGESTRYDGMGDGSMMMGGGWMMAIMSKHSPTHVPVDFG